MDLPLPLEFLVSLVLPPRCPGCGTVTRDDHRFCAGCWAQLRLLAPPWCAACNMPFAYDRGGDARCAACVALPPRHNGVRAAVAYGEIARSLVLRLKYGGRIAFAKTAARHMRRLIPQDADLLVPVPLHRRRLWARGFNQAALIAQALSIESGVPCNVDLLTRRRATTVLRGLGRNARQRAVAGAFAVPPPCRPILNGKSVILVDDVYTSGATTGACTQVLLRAGAARVTILAWARVIDDDEGD